jgi:hypothetical protein
MALQLDYVLSISNEPKTVYAKIEQAITIIKKEIINDETAEIAETLKTNMLVSFYNSKEDREAEKNPIDRIPFTFENQATSSLETAYNLLKTHADFVNAVDILEE